MNISSIEPTEMKLIPNQKSEYGKFDLIPEEGHELRSFIDFESKLLIVRESPIDLSNLSPKYGWKTIPTKNYIIKPTEQKILTFEEWRKYFSYESIETLSQDEKLKEVVTRIHEKERNTDGYESYLVELETGKKLLTSSSVAFYERKRTSLIDSYYKSLEEEKRYLKSIEKGTYPEDKYQSYLESLNEGDLIMQYFDERFVYELRFVSGKFQLKKGQRPSNIKEWESLKLTTIIDVFESIEDFWNYFSAEENWFTRYYLRQNNRVIEKSIISYHNSMVEQGEISYNKHEQLNKWMNECFNKEINRNVYWQFCSNCGDRVYYFPRYPKHACRKCVELIIDEYGNLLDYQNTHELKYGENGDELRLKSNGEVVKIFINDQEYWASEARFGGIVHQKKENDKI